VGCGHPSQKRPLKLLRSVQPLQHLAGDARSDRPIVHSVIFTNPS
jgi:hypothetical protein